MPLSETNREEIRQLIKDEMFQNIPKEKFQPGIVGDEGQQSKPRTDIQQLQGKIEVITDTATLKNIKPRSIYDQIKIEDDGSNGKLWVYVNDLTNTSSNNWKNVTLS